MLKYRYHWLEFQVKKKKAHEKCACEYAQLLKSLAEDMFHTVEMGGI